MKRTALCMILLGVVALFAGCDPVTAQADIYPQPNGWVVDIARVLNKQTVDAIFAQSKALAENGGPEVLVVTLPSLYGETVEGYSIKLADKWKVGKKGKDNGVILLIAMAEHKIRIEVGTGLEPVLNDAKAGRIIQEIIVPAMKKGDMDGGIYRGYQAILRAIKGA